jgi:hypothetical protein
MGVLTSEEFQKIQETRREEEPSRQSTPEPAPDITPGVKEKEPEDKTIYVMAHPDNGTFSRVNGIYAPDENHRFEIENGVVHVKRDGMEFLKSKGFIFIREYLQN